MKKILLIVILTMVSLASKGQNKRETITEDSTVYDATIVWRFQSDVMRNSDETHLIEIAKYLQQNEKMKLTIRMYHGKTLNGVSIASVYD